LQDHRKPVRAPVLRWPVEQPRAAGTAAPAASVLGQVPGARADTNPARSTARHRHGSRYCRPRRRGRCRCRRTGRRS
jgi:hypothetical protein